MTKNKLLSRLLLLLSFLNIFIICGNIVLTGNANADEDFQGEVGKFAESGKGNLFDNILDIDDSSGKENSIQSALSYLLVPGAYMNNISNASINNDNDNSVYNQQTMNLCDVSQPQNLLNHNCDLPSLGTSIAQKVISSVNSYGIQGGEKTPAVSSFGVPSGLPDNKVPIKASDKKGKYTALELYGYNLPFVNYNGEWDNISVSTKARLLSNYGFLDRVNLGVDTIFNSAKAGFKAVVEKFDWNPIKYASNIINASAGNAFWTAIDTSDYNVASTHSWSRPEFSKTLYNVYYMNSKEISDKATAEYNKQVKSILEKILSKDKYGKIRTLFAGDYGNENYPNFVFDDKMYTEESKQARKEWETCDSNYKKAKDEADDYNKHKKSDEPKKKVEYTCGTKPELKVVPEDEQLQRWYNKGDVQAFFAPMRDNYGIDCSSAKTGDEFKACYKSAYDSKVQEEVHNEDVDGQLTSDLSSDIVKEFAKENPHLNPSAGISHYVCADEEGHPMGANSSEYKYVYNSENSNGSESLNPTCAPVRPSVKGGYYGTGNGTSDDTRWQLFNYYKTNKRPLDSGNGFFNWLAQTATKITITAVDFSYSNILDITEFDVLAKNSIESFRDSIFFPLVNLIIAIGAVSLFLEIFKSGSLLNALKSLFLMAFVYILGVVVLSNPDRLVKLIDDVPSKIDNEILTLLSKPNQNTFGDDLCSNTGGENNAKRSLECQIWRTNIFNPWVFGQFGTSYSNLNASEMKNKNGNLVGTGSVDMGGGKVVNNWALYQLSKTKSGTLTETDGNTGYTSKGLYKLVDLQFGPNNGAASDSRYAYHWAGAYGRGGYRLASALVSIAMAIPIVGLSLAKVELSFVMSVLIIFAPFVALFGLLPKGRDKFKNYLLKIVGIILKRVMVTFFLSVMLIIVTSATEFSDNYTSVLIFSLAMALATMLYWKDLINLFNMTAESSQAFLQDNVGHLKERLNRTHVLPPALEMRLSYGVEGTKDAVVGALSGGAAGIINAIQDSKTGYRRTVSTPSVNGQYRMNAVLEGVINGGSKGLKKASSMVWTRQRRHGFGLIDSYNNAKKAGISNLQNEFRIQGNALKFKMDQIGNELENKETLAFKERYNSQLEYQKEYSKLVSMAVARKIPVSKEGLIDIDYINSRLYTKDGKLNPYFNDSRFDDKFLAQVNKVVMYAGKYNESRSNYERYNNAKKVFNNIRKDNYTTDDRRVFETLMSFDPDKKYTTTDKNGNIIKSEKDVNKSVDEFVTTINNMDNYRLNTRKENLSAQVYNNLFKYTDKVLRAKDGYVDNVVYSDDIKNAETMTEKLNLMADRTTDYVKHQGQFAPDKELQDQEYRDSLDSFEKLAEDWDPLKNVDSSELDEINNNQPKYKSANKVRDDVINQRLAEEVNKQNLQDFDVEHIDDPDKFLNNNKEFDTGKDPIFTSDSNLDSGSKWKNDKVKDLADKYVKGEKSLESVMNKVNVIDKIDSVNLHSANKVKDDIKNYSLGRTSSKKVKISNVETVKEHTKLPKQKELFNPAMDIKSSNKIKEAIINSNTKEINDRLSNNSTNKDKIDIINSVVEDDNEKAERIKDVLTEDMNNKTESHKRNRRENRAKQAYQNKLNEKARRTHKREEILNEITAEENRKLNNDYTKDSFNDENIHNPNPNTFGKSLDEKENKPTKENRRIQGLKRGLRKKTKVRQANVNSLANAMKAMKMVEVLNDLNKDD